MSLLRYDITTNDWVIFAPERTRRPNGGASQEKDHALSRPAVPCPFCPGNEHLTDPEICAVRGKTPANSRGWSVRVVANKFPALRIEEDSQRQEEGPLFRFMAGCGAHEVIIESPEHDSILAQQTPLQIESVLRVLLQRFNDLLRDQRFQTIVIFKNHGEAAGTSLRHPHWQLIATPVVPRTLRIKHAVAEDYFDLTGKCLYDLLLQTELTTGKRLVAENAHFAALMPYASRVPFETWILPKSHQASFGRVDPSRLKVLAEILKTVLGKLHVGLEDPAYNLVINTAARGDEEQECFLWHIEILPRLSRRAGFEMGSGMAINTVLPEDAAEFLRTIQSI